MKSIFEINISNNTLCNIGFIRGTVLEGRIFTGIYVYVNQQKTDISNDRLNFDARI